MERYKSFLSEEHPFDVPYSMIVSHLYLLACVVVSFYSSGLAFIFLAVSLGYMAYGMYIDNNRTKNRPPYIPGYEKKKVWVEE